MPVAAHGSEEEKFFKQCSKYNKQVLAGLEKLDKDKFNNETMIEIFNKESLVKWKQIMCPTIGINEQKVDALDQLNVYYRSMSKKVNPKIQEQLALARSNETAAEVNEANQKSQAAARERKEADTWGSRIKNIVGTVVATVAASGLIKWLGWGASAAAKLGGSAAGVA